MSKYIADTYLYRAIGADIHGGCGRCSQSRSDCMCQSLSRMDICGIIDDAPEADVAEVKRGHWTKLLTAIGEYFECSECGEIVSDAVMGQPRFKFCPMCGARMANSSERIV